MVVGWSAKCSGGTAAVRLAAMPVLVITAVAAAVAAALGRCRRGSRQCGRRRLNGQVRPVDVASRRVTLLLVAGLLVQDADAILVTAAAVVSAFQHVGRNDYPGNTRVPIAADAVGEGGPVRHSVLQNHRR
jgi:hypothetical protein